MLFLSFTNLLRKHTAEGGNMSGTKVWSFRWVLSSFRGCAEHKRTPIDTVSAFVAGWLPANVQMAQDMAVFLFEHTSRDLITAKLEGCTSCSQATTDAECLWFPTTKDKALTWTSQSPFSHLPCGWVQLVCAELRLMLVNKQKNPLD